MPREDEDEDEYDKKAREEAEKARILN